MDNKKDSARRPYVRPEVKKVKLDASVLLAKGCKSLEHHGKQPGFGREKEKEPKENSHTCKMHFWTQRNHEHGS